MGFIKWIVIILIVAGVCLTGVFIAEMLIENGINITITHDVNFEGIKELQEILKELKTISHTITINTPENITINTPDIPNQIINSTNIEDSLNGYLEDFN